MKINFEYNLKLYFPRFRNKKRNTLKKIIVKSMKFSLLNKVEFGIKGL